MSFEALYHSNSSIVYIVGQLEKGQEGTPHFQFFVHLNKRVRLAHFKKWNKCIHAKVADEPLGAIAYV